MLSALSTLYLVTFLVHTTYSKPALNQYLVCNWDTHNCITILFVYTKCFNTEMMQ